uniref:Cyclin-dependent kinase 2-associated protein n=2 Tax=Rhodnius prolixus TaxID=13249 RepID=T1H9I0_RHOPR
MEEECSNLDNSVGGLAELNGSPASLRPQFAPGQSKYAQLLAVIEEMGKDIRPTYAGSKSSAERLKRGIVHARILVRECLMETEKSARQ